MFPACRLPGCFPAGTKSPYSKKRRAQGGAYPLRTRRRCPLPYRGRPRLQFSPRPDVLDWFWALFDRERDFRRAMRHAVGRLERRGGSWRVDGERFDLVFYTDNARALPGLVGRELSLASLCRPWLAWRIPRHRLRALRSGFQPLQLGLYAIPPPRITPHHLHGQLLAGQQRLRPTLHGRHRVLPRNEPR